MAFMLPALGGLLGSMLFKKKGGKIVKQTTSGQMFEPSKELQTSIVKNIYPKVQPKKKGGKVKKPKNKKTKNKK